MDKIDKIIFKNIRKRLGKRPLNEDEFIQNYIAELMFLYIDTYGVSKKTIFKIIKVGLKK